MTDGMLLVIMLPLVALGFFIAGRLYEMRRYPKVVEDATRSGFEAGRKAAEEMSTADPESRRHVLAEATLAEPGCDCFQCRDAKARARSWLASVTSFYASYGNSVPQVSPQSPPPPSTDEGR